MNIHHHLDDATLMAYSAATLPKGMALLVACHLSWCPKCLKRAEEAEAIGGALLENLEPVSLGEKSFDSVMALLDSPTTEPVSISIKASRSSSELPAPLQEYFNAPLDSLPWRTLVPGIRHIDLGFSGEGSTRLLRISPGVSVSHHGHKGNELTMILRGSYTDELGRFCAGDIADLDDQIEHQPIVDTNEDCICLIATDAPLQFRGIVGKLVQPLIGL